MSDEADRPRAVQRVLWITLILNVLVAVAKAVYGALTGSLAIASDAMHSALDASSNVLGLLTTRAASNPPDEGHPYGHHKIEILGASLIGIFLAVGAFEFGASAIRALWEQRDAPDIRWAGFAIVGGTLVVNLFVATYEAKKARELHSPFLAADAAHTASDVMVTLGILVSMGLSAAGVAWADPVGALVVLVVIGRVAWDVLRENLGVLVDQAAADPDEIRRITTEVPGVTGCHRIRSRGQAGAVSLDLHLQMDGSLSLREAHELSHMVEDRLYEAIEGLVDVTIHVEPEDDDVEEL